MQQAQAQLGCSVPPSVIRREDIDCPYSHISRLTLDCDGASKTVYLKRLKHEGVVDDAAKRRVVAEYQTMERFCKHFALYPQFRVVRPIAILPDELAVLMEAAPGTS